MGAVAPEIESSPGLLTLDLQENSDWVERELAVGQVDVLAASELVDIRLVDSSRGRWALKARNHVGAAVR